MRFAKDRRRPAWTYSARGVLWRLQTGSPDFLIGEDRLLDAKEVSFFCLDRRTGIPRWEGFVPGGGWWSGIEAVIGGLVLFHGFASPDMPLHLGLTAVDLASGSVVWTCAGVRFLRVDSDAVSVVKGGFEGWVVERLRLETGEVLGREQSAVSSAGVPPGGDLPIELPRPFRETEVADPVLLGAIRDAIPRTAKPDSLLLVQGVEYCVLAFCEPRVRGPAEEGGFRSSLVVLGSPRWGEIYSGVVQRAASTVIPEPFFCQDGWLYFVREHSALVAVPLRVT